MREDSITWPDQDLTKDSCKTVAYHLSRYAQKNIESPSEVLSIESSLRCNGISGICHATWIIISFCRRRCAHLYGGRLTSNIDIGHDDDNGVLLHVERPIIQSERLPKEAEPASWHGIIPSDTQGICDKLDRQGSDGNGGLA